MASMLGSDMTASSLTPHHVRRSRSPDATSFIISSYSSAGRAKRDSNYQDGPEPQEPASSPTTASSMCTDTEKLAKLLFSDGHLRHILTTPRLLLQFTKFLSIHRPQSLTVLVYYLDVLKALQAIYYANAISEAMQPLRTESFTAARPRPVLGQEMEEKAQMAFRYLQEEDLPAYITKMYVDMVMRNLSRDSINAATSYGSNVPRNISDAFFLTDASDSGKPIVFASKGFHEMTQYTADSTFGQHMQAFRDSHQTSPSLCKLEAACQEGKEHCELMPLYRGDGTAYISLLTLAPLCDSRGRIRYYLGTQIEITSLVHETEELQSVNDSDNESGEEIQTWSSGTRSRSNELEELSKMLNPGELQTVRRCGGRMHGEGHYHYSNRSNGGISVHSQQHNRSSSGSKSIPSSLDQPLPFNRPIRGPYREYLLLRPFPALRILFTSPSLRVPGMLQSPFLSRVGGSRRVREGLAAALATGRRNTAKIRWTTHGDEEPRTRWIQCTPLRGRTGQLGVWVVVFIDNPKHAGGRDRRSTTTSKATVTTQILNQPSQGSTAGRGVHAIESRNKVKEWSSGLPQVEGEQRGAWASGTCWRAEDDYSEDELPLMKHQWLTPSEPNAEANATSFLNETDDELGDEG